MTRRSSLVDTPGLHKPHDALGEELNRSALHALSDVDVACLCIDATKPVGEGDAWVAEHVGASGRPSVLVLTKADIARRAGRPAAAGSRRWQADAVRRRGGRLGGRRASTSTASPRRACALLPEGPRYFPRDMRTDQPLEVMIAEFIREKVLRTHVRRGAARRGRRRRRPRARRESRHDAHLPPSSTSSGSRRRASSSARAGR